MATKFNGTWANEPKTVEAIKASQNNAPFEIRKGNISGGLFFRCGSIKGIVGPSVGDKPAEDLEVDLLSWVDENGKEHNNVPCLKAVGDNSTLVRTL